VSGGQHKWYGDVRVGEQIAIDNGRIVLRVEEKSGQRARIRLEFTKPTTVERVEPAMAAFAREGLR
jgi:pyruvate kinase